MAKSTPALATMSSAMLPPTPNDGESTKYRNKVTQCFDDILDVSTQMLVQQQLKTIQLDINVTNGFNLSQQKILHEKVNLFHSLLDDLECTLETSKTFTEHIAKLGKQREEEKLKKDKEREEELERTRKRLEDEEQKAKEKAEQEEKKKTEEEHVQSQKVGNIDNESQLLNFNSSNDIESTDKLDFLVDTPSNLLADFPTKNDDLINSFAETASNKNNKIEEKVNEDKMESNKAASEENKLTSATPADNGNTNNMGASTFDNSNPIDMSMFSGLDGNGFDLGNFGSLDTPSLVTEPTAPEVKHNDSNNVNENAEKMIDQLNVENENVEKNDKSDTNTNNDNNTIGDNTDDYLTLNDFNDLNIDWNANGDPEDIDLNIFNI
ncbi:hypothetical protein TPHA_0A04290 [Tetrapisispora phaffii CBS 4417]|uniref:Mediator complex subunit 2 n=1 Tax=Tetrapisispora phaffii (strain ATCC 24235 / CBS 4417 / NBRC 1672 / NRRL Y-8282 / UCD 70-5) TaxID=1071381 RepID=G8BNM5_TETPH|nr:hypothetical protein TPHA_0A04290 [Tetrapisispora phaffii CBS 4417]CCE61503.1 hypothetical protein TPHA_0A04290 [Tetrapisispora phaffii CBS 4417]